MIWKHGLRGAVQPPSMFSPLDYKAGQRQAYTIGDEALQLFEQVVSTAVGVNSFWSSSKAMKGSSESFGSYKRLPQQCLWQLLVQHALPSAPMLNMPGEITVTPTIQEQEAGGSDAIPKRLSIEKKKSASTQAQASTKAKAKIQLVTAIKSIIAKSSLMGSRRLQVLRRRCSKKTQDPNRKLEQTVPVTEVAAMTLCPNATVMSAEVTIDLEQTSKSLPKTVPWPSFPEHSFNVSGSLDFTQVLLVCIFFR